MNMYKSTFNSSTYICHFNKNHSSKNGQFTSGDGDGDGIVNDHKNQKKKSRSETADMTPEQAKYYRKLQKNKYIKWVNKATKYNGSAKKIANSSSDAQSNLAKKILNDKTLSKGQKAMHVVNSINYTLTQPVSIMTKDLARAVKKGADFYDSMLLEPSTSKSVRGKASNL